ncbi:MAG: hypothetical protein PWP51_1314 [Clostridiales bacterium]|jgi:hypothetical protein|nr:hypothetical protein [Clostridiales bacterium]MDN5298761.1 hypothetical protein [Clostridiales bacterium]
MDLINKVVLLKVMFEDAGAKVKIIAALAFIPEEICNGKATVS